MKSDEIAALPDYDFRVFIDDLSCFVERLDQIEMAYDFNVINAPGSDPPKRRYAFLKTRDLP
jgi:hypothetical protein